MTDYFTSSAQLDEHMAEVVKKYPILYDKQKRGYRDENVKCQTWQRVAEECDVGTGDAARKLFDNLKKRFLKKRLKYRKLKASVVSTELISAAKEEMDSYAFLNWLVPHIRMRRTKRDLTNMEMNAGMLVMKREGGNEYGSDECASSFDETFDDEGEVMENASMVSSSANYVSSSACYTKCPTPVSMVTPQNTPVIDSIDPSKRKIDSAIASIKSDQPPSKKRHMMPGYPFRNGHPKLVNGGMMKSESLELSIEDETDLFGKMIAADIKTFSPRDQCIAKHQIHTVLFELKMTHFGQTSNGQWQSQHPVYVVSGSGVPTPHRPPPRTRASGYGIDSYYPADSSLGKDGNE